MYRDRGDGDEIQTEVAILPVICSDGHKLSTRKFNKAVINRASRTENKNHTQCKSIPFLVSNRKQLNPILGGPYKDKMRVHCPSESVRPLCKNSVGQRIVSAKMLRVKELQNQLTDAHYHLNELANENRLLKALQKRQDSALKRYEGTNAELPRIIHSHHEELKVLQTKYKLLKAQHKQTYDLLKEKEYEIRLLQSQNKHLVRLSKDQHLGEREKLQMQASDLNHQIQRQHETIQMLNRKLTLESKKLKHQLNAEVTKHRNTRKQLNDSLERLKTLEELLNNKEKRLYYNGRLSTFNSMKPTTCQSLTNLENNGAITNFVKTPRKIKETCNELNNKSLPKLLMTESGDSKVAISKMNTLDVPSKSETMASLQEVRKFRLQKSGHCEITSAHIFGNHDTKEKESEQLEAQRNLHMNDSIISQESANKEIKNIMEYHVSDQLMTEFDYLSSNSDSDSDSEESRIEDCLTSPTSKSKNLHARLINVSIDSASTSKDDGKLLKENLVDEPEIIFRHQIHALTKKDMMTTSDGKFKINHKTHPQQNHKDQNISLDDSLTLDIHEISSVVKTEQCQNNDGDRNDQITLPHTSMNDFEHENCESNQDNPEFQSNNEIREAASLTRNYLTDNKFENENVTVYDNLLGYFDKNRDISRKLITSNDIPLRQQFRNHENSSFITRSQPSIINELYSENNLTVTDHNRHALSIRSEIIDIERRKSNDDMKDNYQSQTKNTDDARQESKNQEKNSENRTISYSKQKLLAAMKVIDDNENTAFISNKKTREFTNISAKSQVTENLYRGLPTHMRRRDDIIKDIFVDSKVETKLQSGCSKLH